MGVRRRSEPDGHDLPPYDGDPVVDGVEQVRLRLADRAEALEVVAFLALARHLRWAEADVLPNAGTR